MGFIRRMSSDIIEPRLGICTPIGKVEYIAWLQSAVKSNYIYMLSRQV